MKNWQFWCLIFILIIFGIALVTQLDNLIQTLRLMDVACPSAST